MEATIILPEQMKTEKREKSMRREDGARSMTTDEHQQAEEDNVGRIESFRLEEAFLAACKDGNLPVVRFCLENRSSRIFLCCLVFYREEHLFAQVKAKCVVTWSRLTRTPFHCLSGVETLKSNLTFIRHLTRSELTRLGQVLPELFFIQGECELQPWLGTQKSNQVMIGLQNRIKTSSNQYSGTDMPRSGRRL